MFIFSAFYFNMDYEFNLTWNCILQKQPPEVFYEKRCSYKLHKIHRKTPVPESFLKQNRRAEGCNFIKKETLAQVLSCEFCEMSTNTLFQNTSGRLLLILFVACFYIFHFRHEKVSSCEKLTSGKPALFCYE